MIKDGITDSNLAQIANSIVNDGLVAFPPGPRQLEPWQFEKFVLLVEWSAKVRSQGACLFAIGTSVLSMAFGVFIGVLAASEIGGCSTARTANAASVNTPSANVQCARVPECFSRNGGSAETDDSEPLCIASYMSSTMRFSFHTSAYKATPAATIPTAIKVHAADSSAACMADHERPAVNDTSTENEPEATSKMCRYHSVRFWSRRSPRSNSC